MRRALIIGGAGAIGIGGLWWGSDRLIGGLYEGVKPRLENQIGKVLGHPLKLGPYRGLGVDGLRLGPSRILEGRHDRSSVSARSVTVLVDPLTSLRTRTLVLDLSFAGARADLRRNAKGQFWVLGTMPPGGEPPPLDLTFRLLQPARVKLWGLGPSPSPLALNATGRVGMQLKRSAMDLRARLAFPGLSGSASIQGTGQWKRNRWKADLRLQRLALEPLAMLLPASGSRPEEGSAPALAGHAEGRVKLSLDQGQADCRGDLTVRRLNLRPGAGPSRLRIGSLPLRCREQELEVAESDWTFSGWRGRLAARLSADRRLALLLEARPPQGHALGRSPIQTSLRGRWQDGALSKLRFRGRRGTSQIVLRGSLGSDLDLKGGWRLTPAELPGAERLPDALIERSLSGSLTARGTLKSPQVRVETGQPDLPLLGPWQASLGWRDQQLRLERFSSEHLRASAVLPLGTQRGRGLVSGPLQARISLTDYPLTNLSALLGTGLGGTISASGRLSGDLRALQPDLALEIANPAAGPLMLSETWRGTLSGSGTGGGSPTRSLRMHALTPAPAGELTASLDQRWLPVEMRLVRRQGTLQLSGTPQGYRWQAGGFPLQGLAIAPGPQRDHQPLMADLSGSGEVGLQPLAFHGDVLLERTQFMGVGSERIEADVSYADRNYAVKGRIAPVSSGEITADVRGRWQGPFRARFEARRLTSVLFRQLSKAWPRWRGASVPPRGTAADLGSLMIDTLGGTLQDQLEALRLAQERLAARDRRIRRSSRAERLARLQSSLDADLTLQGPDFQHVQADLEARGHLWLQHEDRDEALASEPFVVQLQGPLGGGEGTFSLSGLSLTLLALLTPVPGSLRGNLGIGGRYRLGGDRPELALELSLDDTSLAEQPLQLRRGKVTLEPNGLALDLSLMAEGASSSVDLAGTIPLALDTPGLELRLTSRGDGLKFLTTMASRAVAWDKGSADLQLLVRGDLSNPIANGFLRLKEGEIRFIGQTIRQIEATVLFDFDQLLLQELTASVGSKGKISGEGKIGLVQPQWPDQTLLVNLEAVPFTLPRISAQGDGQIRLGGSLRGLAMGGDLAISRGTINAQPGKLSPTPDGAVPASHQKATPKDMDTLLEEKWDFTEPLVLLGPEEETSTGESLRDAIPRFPLLSFEKLRVDLGPDLRVVVGRVADFTTGGTLRIGGRLDPSLTLSGVVKLLAGRLSLFTTTFNLDPDAPNVAIFTPSLGLVPYLDVAMRTRVSDSLNVLAPSAVGQAAGTSLAQLEDPGAFSSLNQLNLVLVTVSVSGPADRILNHYELRSSPPLPVDRLVALIGGNSLAGLSGGGAAAALATVVGQTLLSPLLSSLTAAMGQRVSVALYPTYVNPEVNSEREVRSERVPPQLVMGTEIGFDLSDRFKASVLAAPNRSDVPPQFNLEYKASDTLTFEGALDTQGAWESQLRVFFRF